MRLAELSDSTGVAVATLKYYLREGLLHPGRTVSRTQADYDETHVDRVRLVRALIEVGGMSLAAVKRVLDVLTTPGEQRLEVLEAAQRTLAREGSAPAACGVDGGPPRGRVHEWMDRRGWLVDPADPFIADLERTWSACDDVGIGFDEERLDRYADHMEGVAEVDVRSVPADPQAAVRHVILGTVLVDPVLIALRRLAQQHVSRTLERVDPAGPPSR
ncbi:MerR family transcriptional regulator [Knoellia sp. CPCC 206435]|uniref:MerR family transcriptional regulator n=1 Tax=Knoellia terrae TaxID=3404797 RepID=UPI003B42D78C